MPRATIVLLGLASIAFVLVPTGSADDSDGDCWDSGDGRGCDWARGNGWYGCTFAGAYNDQFIGGAALCPDGRADIQWQQ